jgi:hypothetical protein|tara:strand:- start:354 stop:533 length:180 start_codon:yes stop_codon:yes gene_type:complete
VTEKTISGVTPGFKKAVGEIAEEDWTTLMKRERMQDQLPLPGMEQDERNCLSRLCSRTE